MYRFRYSIKKLSFLCFLALTLASFACSNNSTPIDSPSSFSIAPSSGSTEWEGEETEESTGAILPSADKALAALIEKSLPSTSSGAILVLFDGQTQYEQYFGYARVEKEIISSENTTYEIGFITRQFTAAGIMLLVEQGLLDLDSTLYDYYPDYPHADVITIRMLLSMTSGIPDYLSGTFADLTYAQNLLEKGLTDPRTLQAIEEFEWIDVSIDGVYEIIQEGNLMFEPGTSFSISNSGYIFLSDLIERVSGIPYVHFMQKNILTPLGLETASFGPSSETAYAYYYQNSLQLRGPWSPLIADGGLRMSAQDMAKWGEAIRRREAISDESWDTLLAPSEFVYGLGFTVQPDGAVIEHGDVGGFTSTVACIPSHKLTIVILSNQCQEERWADSTLADILEYYGYVNEEESAEHR